MGQFSMEIYAPTGSLLSGNLHAIARALHLDIQKPADKRRVKLTQTDLVKSGHLRREDRRDFSGKHRPFIVAGTPMIIEYDNGEDLI